MGAIRFTFDDDFQSDAGGSLSRKKLDEIHAAAFAEGREAGRAEALNSLEQSCEALLQNVLTGAQNLQARQDEQVALMHKEAAKLAFTIVGKLAPALVHQAPLTEIELLVNQCLKNNPMEPRLVIRVDDAILPTMEEKLDKIKRASGYHGQVVLISEPMAHISDCRVEWANGGAERDFNNLMSTIEETIQHFIEAPETANPASDGQIFPESGILSETITAG